MKRNIKNKRGEIYTAINLILGVGLASFGLESFLIPNGFLDGGITGISLLLSFITPISLPLLLLVLNIPFIILARKQVGRAFAIKTFAGILFLAIILASFDFPILTDDKLLVSIFGGFFLGAGIGLSVRGGSVLDGTEILSVYLNKKTGFSVGEIILFINIIIFSIAGVLMGIEVALYSMVTYLVASKTIDFISQGLEEYRGITIISTKSKQIKKMLIEELGIGVTVYDGKKGSLDNGERIEILLTVLTRLDVFRVKKRIIALDPEALLIEQNVHDFQGGFIRLRKPQIVR